MATCKIKNTWWVDFAYQFERHRIRSPENTRAGAAAYELVLRGRLSRGEPLIPPPVEPPRPERTFADFSAEWFETYVKVNNKPSEQSTKKLVLRRHLVPIFGTLLLSKISVGLVERFKANKRAEGLSPKSVNNILTVLRRCLGAALEWEVIDHVPRITRLPVPPQAFDFLTIEETHLLLAAERNSSWRTMILLALRTGMRIGEILALDWADVSLTRRTITVRRSIVQGIIGTPKNNRFRYIPLTIDLAVALRELGRTSGFVFADEVDAPLASQRAERRLQKACRTAGLREIGWHVMRHTFASHLAMAGAPIPVIQQLLGHSTIEMTMRYAHLSPAALRAAIDVLDRASGATDLEKSRQPAVNAGAETSLLSHGPVFDSSPTSLRIQKNAPLP